MGQEYNHDLTDEIQKAVEKHAQLSDIQLCDKIVEIKDRGDLRATIEYTEALVMRLIELSKKERDSLLKYAETKCEEGNLEYASILNAFVINELSNL